jgi:hypothetical protein
MLFLRQILAPKLGKARERKRAMSEGEHVSQQGKPRLFIERLVLENFKSYAGRQEVGPFHKV